MFAYSYDPWYRGETKRPVDVITDVVNDLGVKILQQYSSHGNVAFSPTGVAFVLAALYEGSAGRGSQQILDAVGLPANRDVTRIGFRDIHRRLRVRSRTRRMSETPVSDVLRKRSLKRILHARLFVSRFRAFSAYRPNVARAI